MIHHVALEVREADAEACVDFWALFGFSEREPPGDLGGRTRWVQREEVQIHLLFADEPVIAPEGHVALVARDYDALMSALKRAGFEPEPRTEHWGSARCFVSDPVGHRVEIMRFPPRN